MPAVNFLLCLEGTKYKVFQGSFQFRKFCMVPTLVMRLQEEPALRVGVHAMPSAVLQINGGLTRTLSALPQDSLPGTVLSRSM